MILVPIGMGFKACVVLSFLDDYACRSGAFLHFNHFSHLSRPSHHRPVLSLFTPKRLVSYRPLKLAFSTEQDFHDWLACICEACNHLRQLPPSPSKYGEFVVHPATTSSSLLFRLSRQSRLLVPSNLSEFEIGNL